MCESWIPKHCVIVSEGEKERGGQQVWHTSIMYDKMGQIKLKTINSWTFTVRPEERERDGKITSAKCVWQGNNNIFIVCRWWQWLHCRMRYMIYCCNTKSIFINYRRIAPLRHTTRKDYLIFMFFQWSNAQTHNLLVSRVRYAKWPWSHTTLNSKLICLHSKSTTNMFVLSSSPNRQLMAEWCWRKGRNWLQNCLLNVNICRSKNNVINT